MSEGVRKGRGQVGWGVIRGQKRVNRRVEKYEWEREQKTLIRTFWLKSILCIFHVSPICYVPLISPIQGFFLILLSLLPFFSCRLLFAFFLAHFIPPTWKSHHPLLTSHIHFLAPFRALVRHTCIYCVSFSNFMNMTRNNYKMFI